MTPDRWARIEELFATALQQPPKRRASHLEEACLDDPGLRREVEGLLKSHSRAASFLEEPASLTGDALGWTVEQPSDLIGESLSSYTILAPLGRGGMGQVYLAEDQRLGRKVAIKLLAAELTADPMRVRRFEQEARAASGLNHPNIVTIHDIGQAPAGHFIVMEQIEGHTLRRMIGEPVSTATMMSLGAQVARALAVAHAAGLAHRDIKPDNLMVRSDGYVKVLDFGLVRLLQTAEEPVSAHPTLSEEDRDSFSDPGILLGTLSHMSPEQARGQPVDSSTDVFSLGIVLYELATGEHPFAADSSLGVLHGILGQSPIAPASLNPQLPRALDELILQMLHKEPRLRPTAHDVAAILELEASKVQDRPRIRSDRHLVGREVEQTKLLEAFESIATECGLMCCITGESGVGKTALVNAFLEDLVAREHPCGIAKGRCSERLAGTDAYLPFLEILDALLRGENGELAARLMKHTAPTWYVHVAPLSPNDSSAERVLIDARMASQQRMKRELVAFLQEFSRSHPIVLLLEDLHWADLASVDLLGHLATHFDEIRVLILITLRPTDLLLAQHPFSGVKLDLQSRGACEEIELGFLTRQNIETFMELRFPGHRLPQAIAELIHTRTEGNPLFMVDLVRDLCARGVIAQEKDQWTLVHPLTDVQDELPVSVSSMIQRKIDQLAEDDRRLLIAASVQGHEFDAYVVARTVDRDPADVEEHLESLDRVHAFIRCVEEREFPDGTLTLRCRFVHALYQNALYESLGPARRATLSATVAHVLLDRYQDRHTEVASELGYLFETARDFERAADHFLQAAKNAAAVYANQEAVDLSRRAIANSEKLIGVEGQRRTLEATTLSAHWLWTLGQFDDSRAGFARAEPIAERLGDQETRIESICRQGLAWIQTGRITETHSEGQRALGVARQTGSRIGEASAQVVIAGCEIARGETAAATPRLEIALNTLSNAKRPELALWGNCNQAILHSFRNEYDEAERVCDWLDHQAQQAGRCFDLLMSLFVRAWVYGNRGQLSQALSIFEKARKFSEINDSGFFLCRIPNCLGWLRSELSDFAAAIDLNEESVNLAREVNCPEAEANAHVNLARDYLHLKEPDRAFDHLEMARQICERGEWLRWRYNIRLQAELTKYWLIRGNLKAASSHAGACLTEAEVRVAPKYKAWAHKLAGDIAVCEERMDDARIAYENSLSCLSNRPCPTVEWRILQALADLARTLKDGDSADRFLGKAQAVVRGLADSIHDDHMRRSFLGSEPIQELDL